MRNSDEGTQMAQSLKKDGNGMQVKFQPRPWDLLK